MSTETMICPCCGNAKIITAPECSYCHARPIDEPMIQPAYKLPSLGPAFAAATVVTVILVAFLMAWLLTNDLRVLRVLVVTLFGDSTALTKSLLQGDPDLLRYHIFTFDAYRLAWMFSLGAIPLSIVGMWLGRRARKLQRTAPLQYGGQKITLTALTASILFFFIFSAAGISYIPRAIQNSRAKHIAATRAQFYELHVQSLNKFYTDNGTYPQELMDLRNFSATTISHFDYWGNEINYTPTALIASKSSAPVFSNYQLVSPGPDGVLDTADDIRMIDGVIVSNPEDADPISGFFTTKNR